MRQEVARLAHQIIPQFIGIDADVHMHTTGQQSPPRSLHLIREVTVALTRRRFLTLPATERVCGSRYGCKPVFA